MKNVNTIKKGRERKMRSNEVSDISEEMISHFKFKIYIRINFQEKSDKIHSISPFIAHYWAFIEVSYRSIFMVINVHVYAKNHKFMASILNTMGCGRARASCTCSSERRTSTMLHEMLFFRKLHSKKSIATIIVGKYTVSFGFAVQGKKCELNSIF